MLRWRRRSAPCWSCRSRCRHSLGDDRPCVGSGLRLLLALLSALALAACASAPTSLPPTAAPVPSVRLDASGARALLDFCQALNQDQPWDEAAIRRMVATPPYQVLVAHHSHMDASFTSEAVVEMLLALRDGKPLDTDSGRLARIYAAYRSACGQLSRLQARLERLADSAVVERAADRARSALPPQAELEATVYLLMDGRSSGYVVEGAIALDLLRISSSAEMEATLAHELHHIGASSLLPEPCSEPDLGEALETLVGLVQEGAATYYIDGWRGSPTPADLERVEAFLRDALSGQLRADQVAARRAELVRGVRGPLYRVGNQMIADLAAARGDAWVQDRLGDPVGLLRAWLELQPDPAFDEEVLTMLEKAESQGECSAWFPKRR